MPRCAGEEGCPKANDGFATLGDAIYSLMVASANQVGPRTAPPPPAPSTPPVPHRPSPTHPPDPPQDLTILAAPSVAYARAMALLWAALYCFVNLLLLNVLLATVYSAMLETSPPCHGQAQSGPSGRRCPKLRAAVGVA